MNQKEFLESMQEWVKEMREEGLSEEGLSEEDIEILVIRMYERLPDHLRKLRDQGMI